MSVLMFGDPVASLVCFDVGVFLSSFSGRLIMYLGRGGRLDVRDTKDMKSAVTLPATVGHLQGT